MKKDSKQKSFQCFYIPVILLDSIKKRCKLLSGSVFGKMCS